MTNSHRVFYYLHKTKHFFFKSKNFPYIDKLKTHKNSKQNPPTQNS
ncbi:hypothetical protein [Pseudomonas sp. FEN]|nr:hypothetical protein [Pseudomonas sp. FEN]